MWGSETSQINVKWESSQWFWTGGVGGGMGEDS